MPRTAHMARISGPGLQVGHVGCVANPLPPRKRRVGPAMQPRVSPTVRDPVSHAYPPASVTPPPPRRGVCNTRIVRVMVGHPDLRNSAPDPLPRH